SKIVALPDSDIFPPDEAGCAAQVLCGRPLYVRIHDCPEMSNGASRGFRMGLAGGSARIDMRKTNGWKRGRSWKL
ncbi:MAG: hypothetical protein LBQ56_05445, partial [Synergistaceae bacterium]|nr:hypothetical protein [Synergistaceae bacterium]